MTPEQDEDPVEAVDRVREELAAREGNDLRRILAAAVRRQNDSGRTVVRLPPRPAQDVRLRTRTA